MPNYPILNTPNNIIVELNSVSKLNNNAFNTTLNYSSASVDSFIHAKITINLNELGTILKKASLKVYCSNNADSQLVLKRSNINKEANKAATTL